MSIKMVLLLTSVLLFVITCILQDRIEKLQMRNKQLRLENRKLEFQMRSLSRTNYQLTKALKLERSVKTGKLRRIDFDQACTQDLEP